MPDTITPYKTYQQTNASDSSAYILVEQSTEYEYRTRYTFIGGNVGKDYFRRKFETRVYEGILTEHLDDGHNPQYNPSTDTDVPTENTAPRFGLPADWKLNAIEYTAQLSTPLSRDCRITYIKQYDWEQLPNPPVQSNNNSGNSSN